MNTVFAFTSEVWEQVVAQLDSRVETAGVITARVGQTDETLLLLGRDIYWVPDDSYAEREPFRLKIRSSGYVPRLGIAERDGSIGVFVHTHPGGNPSPSELDRAVDADIKDVFRRRTRQGIYASLIVGGSSRNPLFSGRIYRDTLGDPLPLERIRVCGDRLTIVRDDGEGDANAEIFDRQIRAFGRSGQVLLGRIHAGVVGAGGTGSAVCEQLLRLGVGKLTVMDEDVVDVSNLSRMHEAAHGDIGTAKVDLIKRRSVELGTGVQVTALRELLRSEVACRMLLDCDVVFGCTDDAFGRSVLSRLAYWYLIPVLDMGFVIDARRDQVHGLFGRVTTLGPGAACLMCRGRISPQQIALEAMTPSERTARVLEGYAPGLDEAAPSVVTYTTLVGSIAVGEMLARLFRIGDDPPPTEILLRLADRTMSHNSTAGLSGHYCIDRSRWGLGDQQPMLGQLWPS